MSSSERPGGATRRLHPALLPFAPEVEQLQAVYDLAVAVGRAEGLPEVFEAALDALQACLRADRASILLFDPDGVMRFKAWRGLSDGYRRAVEGHTPWSPDTRRAAPILVPDVESEPSLEALRPTVRGEGIRALGFIPLYYGEKLLGKFMVYFDQVHVFGQDEVRLSEIIANHVGFAVDRRAAAENLVLYRSIFAHSAEAIAILDPSGRYLEQNASHRALVGYGDDEIHGRTPALVIGEDVFADIAAEVGRRGVVRREVVARSKTGVTRDVDVSVFAVREEDGPPACYVGITRDVTERKREEEAARFLAEASVRLDASLDHEATLATVAHLVVPCLADWCLVDVSDEGQPRSLAACHVDPARVATVQALRERSLARPGGASADPEAARSCMGAEALDRLLRFYGGDAESDRLLTELGTAFAMSVPLIARGVTLGLLTLVSCTPARRYGPAELRVAQDVGRRAGLALDNARLYGAAQEADRRKDEFLALLAHELRNPLAPMVTALQLIDLRPHDQGVAERARAVLGRQVRHMTRLIDDLLDVSRITRGKITLRTERVDVSAVTVRALEAARPLLEGRQLEVAVALPADLWVEADPVRIEQVLANLLNNAAKYTERGGRVRVWAEAAAGRVSIGVADTGIGIAPEALTRIFEPFMQGEQALDRAQGGLGIGLTLVRRLVEMHGGRVHASSAGPGQGSEFVVELPAAPATARAEPAVPPLTLGPAPRPRRVLIVDDNQDAVRTLAEALASVGHRVAVAHDGPGALAEAARLRPEVVLLDIGLPGMDGYAVARHLRAEPALAGTALIALSGYGQERDRQRSHEAGFREHLVKPVDLAVLTAILSSD